MNGSGVKRGSDRRFRRRLALAAVAIGALAGLAMPTAGTGDAAEAAALARSSTIAA